MCGLIGVKVSPFPLLDNEGGSCPENSEKKSQAASSNLRTNFSDQNFWVSSLIGNQVSGLKENQVADLIGSPLYLILKIFPIFVTILVIELFTNQSFYIVDLYSQICIINVSIFSDKLARVDENIIFI